MNITIRSKVFFLISALCIQISCSDGLTDLEELRNQSNDLIVFIKNSNLFVMDLNGNNIKELPISPNGQYSTPHSYSVAQNGRFILYRPDVGLLRQYDFITSNEYSYYPGPSEISNSFSISPQADYFSYCLLQDQPVFKSNIILVNSNTHHSINLTNMEDQYIVSRVPPAFTPDESHIAFLTTSGKIEKIGIDGNNHKILFDFGYLPVLKRLLFINNSLMVVEIENYLYKINLSDSVLVGMKGKITLSEEPLSLSRTNLTGTTLEGKIFLLDINKNDFKIIAEGDTPCFSSDEKYLIFQRYMGPNNHDIIKYNIHKKTEVNLTKSNFSETFPKIFSVN
jgi:Tol biopolymer transport system component